MLPGVYEELILDFWEQAQPSQVPKVLLMNDYGGEEAPWFTLTAKLPLKEMEAKAGGEAECRQKSRRTQQCGSLLPQGMAQSAGRGP